MQKTQQIYLYSTVTAFLLILYSIALATSRPIFFPLDDAYIVLHNIAVLLSGVDHNYIGTPVLYGTTSPIHLALAALLIKIIPSSPAVGLFTLNWLYILFYALGICRLAVIHQCNPLQTIACLFLASFAGAMPYQLLNGLETGLSLAVITWTLVFLSQPLTTVRKYSILLSCAWMPYIRPELAAFSGLVFLFIVCNPCRLSTFIKYFIILFSFALPWVIWMYMDTGEIFTPTIAAKTAFFAQNGHSCRLFLKVLKDFINIISLPFALFSIFLYTSAKLPGKIILGFMFIFLTTYFFINPLVLFQNYNRYLYIFIPFLLLGGLAGLKDFRQYFRISANILLVVACIYEAFIFPPAFFYWYIGNAQHSKMEFQETVAWCQKNIPANAVILVQDAGYMAYATHFTLIDMVGLKTPESIYYHQNITYKSGGKNRIQAIAAISKKFKAQYLIITPEWETHFGITNGLKKLHWTITLLHKSPRTNGYLIYQLTPPSLG